MDYLTFASPHWLWALFAIPVAGYFLRRRSRKVWLLQTLMLLFLVLAASRPFWRYETMRKQHIVLMEEKANPEILPAEYSGWNLRKFTGSPAAALLETGALLPEGGGTVVLLGNLIETDHSLESAIEALNLRGISVRAVAPASPSTDRPVLRDLTWPSAAGVGSSVTLRLVLESAGARTVDIAVTDESGRVLNRIRPELKTESNVAEVKLPLPRKGLFRGSVLIDGKREAEVAIDVREAFPALLISEKPEQERDAVRRLFQNAVAVEVYRPGMDISRYPLVILGEGAAGTLPRELQKAIVKTVRDGAGLLAATGRKALFAESAVEKEYARLFPVSYEGEQEKKIPTVSLVVIIDTSGSMRGTRIDLARETARLALENLKENDLAGIVEFHGARRWAAPLQSAANQFSLMRALNRLNAGGGTVILPAVNEAFYALRNTNSRLKHVLILTDGGVEYGDFETLIRKMARNDITVSTVMVGPGDSDFLRRLALWGNGRFFRASSRFAIPDLKFHPQGIEPLPPYREGSFSLRPGAEGITSELPSGLVLGGFVKSTPGKDSEILLEAEKLPVLATVRRGLGKTAVLNTEWNGAWTQKLAAVPEYSAMLTALVRSLPDRVRFTGIAAWNRSVNRDLDFEFETAGDRPELEIVLNSENGKIRTWKVSAGENGTFRFRLPDLPEGVYRLQVKDFEGDYYFVSRKAPDVSPLSPQKKAERLKLTSIPEGHQPVRTRLPLAPWLGGLGLLFLVLQLGVRRFAGKGALAVLLFAGALMANGAEYDALLRKGVLQEEAGNFAAAAETYRKATLAADNAEDRNFSEILYWETSRRAGKISGLVEEALKAGNKRSGLQTTLLIHELEERGENQRAWALASARQEDPSANAEEILRLAERAGQNGWIREQSRKLLSDPSTRTLGFYLAVRLALLNGERSKEEQLYKEQIEKSSEPEWLLELARTAESQALYKVAESALLKAAGTPGNRYWPALFQLVGMYRTTGEIAKASDLLLKWTREKDVPAGVLLTAGDLCEQLGKPDAAIKLYRESDAEDAQIRTAMLEEIRGNADAAASIWEKITLNSETEMRARQAAERLVELNKKASTLKAFCNRLASKANAPGASPRLITLYTRALAAAEETDTLFAFLEKHGMKDQVLNYRLELRQYPEAVKVLRRELAESPDRKEKILQQLALVAVEMKDKDLAVETLTALLASEQKGKDGRYEFAGAIYSLTGDYRKAAECYERALQLAPEKSELLLLWGKARQSLNESGEVLEFFSSELKKEKAPERFGVLVDGLLNLNAPKPMLEAALEEVLKRVNAAPENLFYYQLAEDLAEELGKAALGKRLERYQLAVAPERRTLLLQKLFSEARRTRNDSEALFYGRILMDRNEHYNPELYRDLCDLLVDNKFFAAAERCVRDADHTEGGTENLFVLADTLSRYLLFADAERVYRELLVLTPNRIDLLEKYAAMLEFQGRYDAAAEASLKALRLICAPQSTEEKSSGRGTREEESGRQFQRVMPSFVNLAILNPEKFRPRIEDLKKNAPNRVQKEAWQSVLDRLALLNGEISQNGKKPERKGASVSSRNRIEPVSAGELSAKISALPPAQAAAEVEKVFKALPEARRERYWIQVVDSFDFEPAGEVVAALKKEQDAFRFDANYSSPDWDLPYAAKLKKEYAERALASAPVNAQNMALAARMRHLAGEGFSARMLAELIYEEIEKQKEISPRDVSLLQKLNRIYTVVPGEESEAGREALAEQISARTEKMKTKATVQGLVVLASLFQAQEDYDKADQVLSAAWNANRNAYTIFNALNGSVQKSGRWADWAKFLQEKAPSDQTSLVLYCMRLVPYLRTAGERQSVQKLIPLMNPLMQPRERLLLARASGDSKQLAAELMSFLRYARENRGSYSLFDQNPYTGGIRGWKESRRAYSRSLFSEIAGQVPECRNYLEFLLQGTPPDSPSFRLFWNALKAMPQEKKNGGEKAYGNTLASLILKADSAPEKLSPEEKKKLLNLVEQYSVPLEIGVNAIKVQPKEEREKAAVALTEKLLEDRGGFSDGDELRPLLELLPPDVLRQTCLRLKASPYRGYRDSSEFQLLKLLRTFAPDLYDARLKETAYPSDAMVRMLTPGGTGPVFCRNFLIASRDFPEWQNIVSLYRDTPALAKLTRNFSAALEELGKTRTLSSDQLVRHYSLLAVYDVPSRRAQWLEAAFRHHRATGEASLWLLDALEFNKDMARFQTLKKKLEAEQRILPNRGGIGILNVPD